jgi:hypothetical protein
MLSAYHPIATGEGRAGSAGSCHIRTSSQIDAAYVAYKLYSDGSIEAQLLQGTLRFGLITD